MRLFTRHVAPGTQDDEPTGRLHKAWQFWFVPLLIPLVLAPFLWVVYQTVQNGLKNQVEGQLESVLRAEVAGLHQWVLEQTTRAQLVAAQEAVGLPAAELVATAAQPGATRQTLLQSDAYERLVDAMTPLLGSTEAEGWVVLDQDGTTVASDYPALVGEAGMGEGAEFVVQAARGESVLSPPFMSAVPLPDPNGGEPHVQPTMLVAAPLRDQAGDVVATLALRLPPEEFSQILSIARWGESGETYAFDDEGLLLTHSRFEDQLKEHGLLPDSPDATSILNVRVADPGYNTLTDAPPRGLSPDRPLTRMAASAVTGSDGVDAQGYRDYRGVPVVGAWAWLKDLDFGITTEVDVAEAYGSLTTVRWIYFALTGLLIAAAVALAVFSRSLYFTRIRERDTKKADRLGHYSLEEKIGEGGLGEVWKASHVLLRRPTAVKLLHRDRVDKEEMERFEREVQLSSRLTSPHTIRVYDYGVSPDGVFYYAMEYLAGADLHRIVERTGPLPEARALSFLVQACESLQEAHGQGIIHRDIKPANLIVSPHGTDLDFIVLSDFGLAKELWAEDPSSVTNPRFAVGTPRYLAPEALRKDGSVDELGDIYSLGASAYFMLAGSDAVTGVSVLEVLQSVLIEDPEPPSARAGRAISPDVEDVVMRCLAKDPDDRPQSAEELSAALRSCVSYGSWTDRDARDWWAEHEEQLKASVPPSRGQLSPELLKMANQWNA